jgi:DNA polymerase I-like protein with 3'-5' exonuclease and polymerase domains
MIYLVSNQTFLPEGIYSASPEDVFDFVGNTNILSIDTETTGGFDFESTIITFQIGNETDQFVVDAQYYHPVNFKLVLEDDSKLKLFQNANFDNKFFRQLGILTRNVYDTFLAELVLNCGLQFSGFSLDKLAHKYTNYNMSKDPRGKIKRDGLTKEVIEYAAKDVQVLEPIMNEQWKKAKSISLHNVIRLENKTVLGLSEMEYNGIKVDAEELKQVAKEDEEELQNIKTQLDNIVIQDDKLSDFIKPGLQLNMFEDPRQVDINYNSPLQIEEVFRRLNIDTSNGTGKRELEKKKNQHKFVETLINYREQHKLVSNYGKRFLQFINPVTKKIHTSFWQILNTGRVSSGQKGTKYHMGAPNMQNIPANNRYRNLFKADKDHKLVMSDYGSQELALIADDSQDNVWLDTISNGEDLHSVVAEKVFGQDWQDATEQGCEFASNREKCSCKGHKSMRIKIKTINYALSYGAGPAKIADTLNISVNEASDIVQMYFDTFYTLRDYFEGIKTLGKSNLRIRTFAPFHRARFFQKPTGYPELGNIERESTNTRIQGTGADIIKLAIWYIFDYIHTNNYPAKLCLQVHDELITQVREDKADEWVEIKEDLMRQASDVITNVRIDVESTVSDRWEK